MLLNDLSTSELWMDFEIAGGSDAESLLEDSEFCSEWGRLCRHCSWATPFQGPDFARTWYRIYRDRFEPVLFLARDKFGALNGLLPLARSISGGGLVAAGSHQAEYQGWVCAPELADRFAEHVVRTLNSAFPGAILTLRYLPPGTPTGWFASAEGRRSCQLVSHRRPLLRLVGGKEILRSLNKKSNKSRLKRLERIGALEFLHIRDAKEFETLFDELIQYYDFRQAAVHDVSPFGGDDLKKPFHLALMGIPGLLHTTVLKVGGQLAAAHVGASGDKEVQLGIIAHNPLFARHSPGKFLILLLAQRLMEQGYERLDLTAGGDPYKDRFANGSDEVHTLVVFPSLKRRATAAIRSGLAQAAKRSLRTVGIDSGFVKSLVSSLAVRDGNSLAALMPGVRKWIGRQRETCVYSLDATKVLHCAGSGRVRCNFPEDLLRYPKEGGGQSRRRFLSASLVRIENGLRIYTYAEGERLLVYGWLSQKQEEPFLGEAGQGFGFPTNSAFLFDFYELSPGWGKGLWVPLLQAMLRDAAEIQGTARTFVSVPAHHTTLRSAIEEVGFHYHCSLFEQVRLGRARRWSHPRAPR
jgi:CelD/BcsL family acetyltransferase involved in cellulose biosynthesis